jgi:hypothetical protein
MCRVANSEGGALVAALPQKAEEEGAIGMAAERRGARLESGFELDLRSVKEARETERRRVGHRRSAADQVGARRPTPGPMPKPWPEKPVAMRKPGTA